VSKPIQARIGLSGILKGAIYLCLLTSSGWSETNSASNGGAATPADKVATAPETLVWAQQLQEQYQQLLQAIDLIRREAELDHQRYSLAVDRIRKDTEFSLQRYAGASDVKIDRLARTFSAERERELEALRRSNRFALISASIVVGILLLELLFVAWISIRAVNRLAARISGGNAGQSPGFIGDLAEWEMKVARFATAGIAGETSLRLENAIDRLERRLLDLEQIASRPAVATRESAATLVSKASVPQPGSHPSAALHGKHSGVSLTVGAGESLIFLPHEKGVAKFPTAGHFLAKLWKRMQPARMAKGE